MPRLINPDYLAFPLRITADGAATSGRAAHVREQIEQVLFTEPGERVFRPEFGAGIRALIFEPNGSVLAGILQKRLIDSLSDALQGEVDPKSLEVKVHAEGEKLLVWIAYALATIGHSESYEIPLSGGS
ncbi:MAG: GPW/gp25 family protein [Desulfuromonadales bacterium]|nr:GPW/gp25 family protein [Desulfuromonadales bacterium]MCK4690387.1 GPW/gp25 family protein [Desulfuromonadales bacterium]